MTERVVAVDLGGTHIRTALADRSLNLEARTDRPTQRELGPQGVVAQVVEQVTESIRLARAARGDVRSLAIGSPGPLDSTTGTVLGAPNLPGWDNVPLGPMLESALGLHARIINDANAGALAEFHLGAGRGCRNLVYLTVSTGIGGGVVVEGRLLEGSSGAAGEIGHTTVDRFGPICNCGNRGCLEAISSGTGIASAFRERAAAGEETGLRGNVPSVTAEDVVRAAAAGDPLAASVFLQAAEALGYGVVNCIHIFNPDVIVLGGGVMHAGALIWDPVRRIVAERTLGVPRGAVRIVPAALGDDVVLIGATASAWAE